MSRSSLKHQNIIIQESDGKQTYISLEGYSWIKAKFSKVELKRYMEDSGENWYLNLGSEKSWEWKERNMEEYMNFSCRHNRGYSLW